MNLKGYRTIIMGYIATVIPAMALALESGELIGPHLWLELSMLAAGPVIHYFRRQA